MFVFAKAKRLTTALVIGAAIATGAPAFAEPFISNGRTAEVRYGDLDLSQSAGRAELKRRLNKAAFRVCASNNSAEMIACRRIAIRHIAEPVNAVLAQAEARARYAEAAPNKAVVDN